MIIFRFSFPLVCLAFTACDEPVVINAEGVGENSNVSPTKSMHPQVYVNKRNVELDDLLARRARNPNQFDIDFEKDVFKVVGRVESIPLFREKYDDLVGYAVPISPPTSGKSFDDFLERDRLKSSEIGFSSFSISLDDYTKAKAAQLVVGDIMTFSCTGIEEVERAVKFLSCTVVE